MSRRTLVALAVIAVNAAIMMASPKPAFAQDASWGCGYRTCAPNLVSMCFSDPAANVHVCECACTTPGAGGTFLP